MRRLLRSNPTWVSGLCCRCGVVLSVVVLLFNVQRTSAQTMSLQQCIDYALEHNNSIHQQELQRQSQEVALQSSRFSRLPEVDASVGQNWSFGRSTSVTSNTYSSGNSTSTNLGISASVPLFTGFRITNQIKSDRYSLEAASATLAKARKDVSIQVSTYYLNALYYRGLAQVQRSQVELDSVALVNARTLFEAGRKPESEVATAEAQLALSRHNLTEAIGNETLARLDLMQSLNLDGDVSEFAILDIDTTRLADDMGSAAQIFDEAVEAHPSIMAAKYRLESSKYDLKVSRSSILPQLNLSAGYSASYQYMYGLKDASGRKLHQASFGQQLGDFDSKYISLSLRIPIFDRFSTRNNMRRARLNIESQETNLIEAQQSLRKEIQQAYWNAVKARDNYRSSQKANASTSLAYQYEAERYAAGRGTPYDLQQASAKVQRARQDEMQARYELLMRLKILEFYNAQPD